MTSRVSLIGMSRPHPSLERLEMDRLGSKITHSNYFLKILQLLVPPYPSRQLLTNEVRTRTTRRWRNRTLWWEHVTWLLTGYRVCVVGKPSRTCTIPSKFKTTLYFLLFIRLTARSFRLFSWDLLIFVWTLLIHHIPYSLEQKRSLYLAELLSITPVHFFVYEVHYLLPSSFTPTLFLNIPYPYHPWALTVNVSLPIIHGLTARDRLPYNILKIVPLLYFLYFLKSRNSEVRTMSRN
jgi:hypothetical protein